MQNRTVTFVWIAGLALAALVYATGPDRFLSASFALADNLAYTMQRAIMDLGGRAYDLLRALAIACFAVFFVLSVIAAGRGLPVRAILVVVTLLFLVVVWHEGPEATGHWLVAFALAAGGAASVSRQLAMHRPPVWTGPPNAPTPPF